MPLTATQVESVQRYLRQVGMGRAATCSVCSNTTWDPIDFFDLPAQTTYDAAYAPPVRTVAYRVVGLACRRCGQLIFVSIPGLG